MIGKLYRLADQLYQALTQSDRPIEADVHRKPWLASLYSILVCGGGQLYNRQLAKAVWYFLYAYVPLGVIWGVYLLFWTLVDDASPAWLVTTTYYVRLAAYVSPLFFCIIWSFGVMDAYRTAILLRSGEVSVRYGLKRQALHLAAGFVPVVGEYVPNETMTPGEPRRAIGDLFKQDFRRRLVKRIVTRLVGFGCMVVIMLALLIGVLVGVAIMISSGGLKMK